MAMKVNPNINATEPAPEPIKAPETKEIATQQQTALADPSQFLQSLQSLCSATPQFDVNLPNVKLLWAIEAQNSDTYNLEDAGKLLLTSGSSYEILPPGTLFTVLASRNACRRLVETEDGKEYSRAYAQIGTVPSASSATYKANCSNAAWQQGVALLVAVVNGDKVSIATWEMFKADPSYFFAKLNPATLHNRMALKINTPNHMKNLKPNKAGTGSYLDKSKFTQHEMTPLTDEQVQVIASLVVDKQAQFQAWLEK